MTIEASADVLDRIVGVTAGSNLDRLRRERPVTRLNIQVSYEALFAVGDQGGVSQSERLAPALFVSLLHGEAVGAAHYGDLLKRQPEGTIIFEAITRQAQAARTGGPYGAYPAGPLSQEDVAGPVFAVEGADAQALGRRLAALLAHAHLLVFHPRDASAEALAALRAAGWSTPEIVTMSQIVAFLSFQIRAAHGLRLLNA
jgi:CMD domain protein